MSVHPAGGPLLLPGSLKLPLRSVGLGTLVVVPIELVVLVVCEELSGSGIYKVVVLVMVRGMKIVLTLSVTKLVNVGPVTRNVSVSVTVVVM